jgi:hypothetical protein
MQKTGTKPSPTAAIEPHFTVPELSNLLNLAPRAVRRMFQDEPTTGRIRTAPQPGKRSPAATAFAAGRPRKWRHEHASSKFCRLVY